jgi:hypothetical protein
VRSRLYPLSGAAFVAFLGLLVGLIWIVVASVMLSTSQSPAATVAAA